MPTYAHFQQVKRAEPLPEKEKVGVCLTCTYWDVEEQRAEKIVDRDSRCVHPALKEYALIVSGASACNVWQEKPNVGREAKEYAERGEAS